MSETNWLSSRKVACPQHDVFSVISIRKMQNRHTVQEETKMKVKKEDEGNDTECNESKAWGARSNRIWQ
jgi:hypothetical protein